MCCSFEHDTGIVRSLRSAGSAAKDYDFIPSLGVLPMNLLVVIRELRVLGFLFDMFPLSSIH